MKRVQRGSAVARLLLAGALVAAVLPIPALSGCSQINAASDAVSGSLDPAEQSVQSLLELRAEASTDASAYAEFVSENMAAALAAPQSEEASGALIPEWESPYLSAEDSATASVVVVWVDAEAFDPAWPEATIFRMELVEDRWIAVDAEPIADKEFAPDRM